ncbi:MULTISPECIES: type I secretion system permease/ATPase [unclassified Aureimonas]|uniref:type I secretion system permease/ATPase n=1 Tax=unclassified Aureimonas TaxID=2615206 RepID=UPI0006F849C3|nr:MULTISPECIES: type I secretion system permease/ATPase [unclassified Aureimonas]KQT62050.1 hypothetical protein ASG54_23315 [Aureimonas sp. Leaf460]KQT69581.1 hypothetical protein ASG62_00075 [Aureimonas sp. Leaf427]
MRIAAEQRPKDRLYGTLRSGVVVLAIFTFVVDILLFVQPVYMLQVYDRVLPSGSIETLIYISLIALIMLILLGVMEAVRSMIAARIAARVDVEIGSDTLVAAMSHQRAAMGDVQPLRDLGTVRNFISTKAILAYLDLPFAPVFIGILYFIHPHLFFLTVGGAVILALLAIFNQMATSAAGGGAENSAAAMLAAQAFARSSETIRAMGMTRNVIGTWGREEASSLRRQEQVNAINAGFSGASRAFRLALQIAILGYGGYLVVEGQMTAGMIFASSLISGRGLQPIDQVIGGWRGFVETRGAWKRVCMALDSTASEDDRTELPIPRGRITLDQVVVYPPSGGEPLLKRISATIPAGERIAIVGPSGAGKSIVSRTIVGAIRPQSGVVRVDGADIRTWRSEQLGRYFGYLSQDVDLLPGTIAENIARFDPNALDEQIVAAAQKAQVHDLILNLPRGYNTVIGPTGQQLSGGQRQRIGLARAFFGNPKMLVLDEPNANLDSDGELALERALDTARLDGITAIVVTQRRHIADKADKVMIIRDGMIEDYGPRNDVYARQSQKAKERQEAVEAAKPAKVLSGRFGGGSLPAPAGTPAIPPPPSSDA